jgi:predicted RNase H-like HicB family nuclease
MPAAAEQRNQGPYMKYAIVIEQRGTRFRAYVPDLPGCTASGSTLDEVESSIRLAIQYHIMDLKDDGAVVPAPASTVNYVAVSA